ncbi:MAG: aminoglycoside phosphotransferase family protein [Fimbriimonadaceae bacterium]
MPHPESLIRTIADRHGLAGGLELLPKGGMVNEAWAIGDSHILRIVTEGNDAECDDEAPREAAVVPLVVVAGITAPRLVAHDLAFAPRPYSIYEMASGELVGYSGRDYGHFTAAYGQMGRDLTKLHSLNIDVGARTKLRTAESYDFEKWIARAEERGSVSKENVADIKGTVARWREIGGQPAFECLVHNDLHPWNLMGDPETGALTAILDWGDASFGDPARDFAMMPLPCVPAMLDGYASTGGTVDDAFVARSLVVGMSVALFEVSTPEMADFYRRWWRMPPGGWSEMKSLVAQFWPELM